MLEISVQSLTFLLCVQVFQILKKSSLNCVVNRMFKLIEFYDNCNFTFANVRRFPFDAFQFSLQEVKLIQMISLLVFQF